MCTNDKLQFNFFTGNRIITWGGFVSSNWPSTEVKKKTSTGRKDTIPGDGKEILKTLPPTPVILEFYVGQLGNKTMGVVCTVCKLSFRGELKDGATRKKHFFPSQPTTVYRGVLAKIP